MRVQASLLITLPSQLGDLRQRLDPRMDHNVPPHITIIYDDEAPDAGLLQERLRESCQDFAPVALQLGGVETFAPPASGLYVAAKADPTFDALRARVLRPPFAARGPAVRPHVTLLHPSSVADAPTDWQCHAESSIRWQAIVREVTVMESAGGPWRIVAQIPLGPT